MAGLEGLARSALASRFGGAVHNSANVDNKNNSSSSTGYESDESSDEGSPKSKGRFSKSERAVLFGIIREDSELLRSFLNQLKRRIWDGKSWMHEIGTRFNQRSGRPRTHDAVRHHLKLRRPALPEAKSQRDQEDHDFISLLEHTIGCSRREACTRCLQLQRLRVKRGLAKCGHPACNQCDETLPFVFDAYDTESLFKSAMAERPDLVDHASGGAKRPRPVVQLQARNASEDSRASVKGGRKMANLAPLGFGPSEAGPAAQDGAPRPATIYPSSFIGSLGSAGFLQQAQLQQDQVRQLALLQIQNQLQLQQILAGSESWRQPRETGSSSCLDDLRRQLDLQSKLMAAGITPSHHHALGALSTQRGFGFGAAESSAFPSPGAIYKVPTTPTSAARSRDQANLAPETKVSGFLHASEGDLTSSLFAKRFREALPFAAAEEASTLVPPKKRRVIA